jgi:hypothetical protein
MNRHSLRHGIALAASLSLMAGCASPVAPVAPAPVAPEGQPAAVIPAAVGEPSVAPAPPTDEVALAPVVFEGVATYRGEALAGYTVGVYNLGTDEPIGEAPDADGLALLSRTATTDAAGRYRIEVAGLRPGFDVRVMVSSPQETGTLFATLTAPDAETPELTAGQGAINEETTLASLLTEGASGLLWASVEAHDPAAGYRLAQAAAPAAKAKALSPGQKTVLAATKAHKAEVAKLAKPVNAKAPYEMSAQILGTANNRKAKQKQSAKAQAEKKTLTKALETKQKEELAKASALEAKKQEELAKALEAKKQEELARAEMSAQWEQLDRTQQMNALVMVMASNKGIQEPLIVAAIKLVNAVAKAEPMDAKPVTAPANAPLKKAPKAAKALLGTPLAVTVAPDGMPEAVVNTSTNKTLDLATVKSSGGAALSSEFAAPASRSSSPSQPAPVVTAVSQAKASAGTILTLTGDHFSTTLADNVVTINGATATPRSATATSLQVAVPAGATLGAGSLAVAVRGVNVATPTAFTVVARGTVLQTLSAGNTPLGVAIDSAGDVYVAMLGESVVKQFRNGALQATHATGADTGLLVVDRFDHVWVTTGGGLKQIVDGVVTSTGITGVSAMAFDASGRLWLSRSNMAKVTCLTLDGQGGYTSQDITLPTSAAWGAIAASGTTVWVGARRYDAIIPITGGVAGAPLDTNPTLDSGQIGTTSMATAPGGEVWVSAFPEPYHAGTRLLRVGGTPAAIVDTDSIAGFAEQFAVAADGAVWGTLRYRDQLVRFNADGTVSHTFSSSQPIGLTADAAGNLWVGSINDGMVSQYAP